MPSSKRKNFSTYYKGLSTIDAYNNRIFTLVAVIAASSAMLSGIIFSYCYLLGWYPDVQPVKLVVFDLGCCVYAAAAAYFVKSSFDETGALIPSKFKVGTTILTLGVVFHWNLMSYIFPTRSLWGYAPFFVMLIAFFFNYKNVDAAAILIFASIIISWEIVGDPLLPARDEHFYLNIATRVFCLIFSFLCIHLLTYFVDKYMISELEKLTEYDMLTKLHNRNLLDSHLQRFYSDAVSGAACMSMAILDIDDFKKVNDTYGHSFGDEVLKEVASIISSSIYHEDKAFRWGGEELLILFKCDKTQAASTCQRIRKQVESMGLKYNDETVVITVTAGIASYEAGNTTVDIFNRADENLYRGKRSGKNQVVY